MISRCETGSIINVVVWQKCQPQHLFFCHRKRYGIAERHNVSASTAARLFRMVSPPARTLDEAISIDEFRGNAGAKFQVVINSLSKRECLAILPDRSPDSLYASILQYPLEERIHGRMQYDHQDVKTGMLWIQEF